MGRGPKDVSRLTRRPAPSVEMVPFPNLQRWRRGEMTERLGSEEKGEEEWKTHSSAIKRDLGVAFRRA